MMRAPAIFQSWGQRLLNAAGILLAFWIVTWMIPGSWIPFLVGPVAVLVFRSLRLGVVFSNGDVVVRNFFWSTKHDVHEVSGFRQGPGQFAAFSKEHNDFDVVWIDLKDGSSYRVNGFSFLPVSFQMGAGAAKLERLNRELDERQRLPRVH